MKNPITRPFVFAATCALLALSGCTTQEGPTVPTDPNAAPVIRGKEPAPAPIPQKNVPPDASSLDHKNPDQRIDQPKN